MYLEPGNVRSLQEGAALALVIVRGDGDDGSGNVAIGLGLGMHLDVVQVEADEVLHRHRLALLIASEEGAVLRLSLQLGRIQFPVGTDLRAGELAAEEMGAEVGEGGLRVRDGCLSRMRAKETLALSEGNGIGTLALGEVAEQNGEGVLLTRCHVGCLHEISTQIDTEHRAPDQLLPPAGDSQSIHQQNENA